MLLFFAALFTVALLGGILQQNDADTVIPDIVRGDLPSAIYSSAALAIFVAIGVAVLYSGTNKGGAVFSMSDVHFLFTAPIIPQSVLFYGLVGTLKVLFAAFTFVPFQFPNLARIGMTFSELLLILLLLIGVTFVFEIGAMLCYLIAQNRPTIRKALRGGIILIPFLFLGWLIMTYLQHRDITQTLIAFSFQPAVRIFPLFGWSLSIAQGIFLGMDSGAWLSISFLAVSAVLMLITVFKLPADFYEDAIVQTQKTAEQVALQQNIGAVKISERIKRNKGVEGIGRGRGGSTIFFRYYREWRRKQPLIIGTGTLVFIFIFGLISFLLRTEETERAFFPLIIYLVTFSYLFFRNLESPFLLELTRPNIYLVPIKPAEKLIWLSVTDLVSAAASIFPGSLLAMIILDLPLSHILVLTLAILTFPLVTTAASLITFRLMGSIKGQLEILAHMLFEFILSLPSIGAGIAAGILHTKTGVSLAIYMLIFPFLNIITLLITIPVGKNILYNGLD